jgi:predicted nucleic acid-binding protein
MKKIMFDSNVFDKLSRIIGKIKDSAEKQYEYYITVTQVEELCKIPDSKMEKRIHNMIMLADLRPKLVPISAFVLGKARLGYARLGSGQAYYKILNDKHSNINDAIIADTSVFEGCTLITEDKDLFTRMTNHGYDVMYLDEFINTIIKP